MWRRRVIVSYMVTLKKVFIMWPSRALWHVPFKGAFGSPKATPIPPKTSHLTTQNITSSLTIHLTHWRICVPLLGQFVEPNPPLKELTGKVMPNLHPVSWTTDLLARSICSTMDAELFICGVWSLWTTGRNRRQHGQKSQGSSQTYLEYAAGSGGYGFETTADMKTW
jgi:hypothetical protein